MTLKDLHFGGCRCSFELAAALCTLDCYVFIDIEDGYADRT